MYYVYVLRCSDQKFYIGYSSNLKNRITEHLSGYARSTKGRLPVILIFYEAFLNYEDAKRREKYFKTTAGKRALGLMLRRYLSQ